jgi:hypothetical protein
VVDNPGVLMRLIKYDGIEHLLTEHDWKQILRRFDADRASVNVFGYYFIRGKSICVNRDYKCIRCPLRDPRKKTNSCTYLFEKIIGEEQLYHLHLRDSGILWDAKDDDVARLALQKVTDVLSKAIHIKLKKSV